MASAPTTQAELQEQTDQIMQGIHAVMTSMDAGGASTSQELSGRLRLLSSSVQALRARLAGVAGADSTAAEQQATITQLSQQTHKLNNMIHTLTHDQRLQYIQQHTDLPDYSMHTS